MNSSLSASMNTRPESLRNALLEKILNPAPRFALVGPGDSGREPMEALVAAKFRSAWQAEVNHFLPWLLEMNCLGSCSAVAGIRPAASGALFLEQYLDQPAERLLGEVLAENVQRCQLVEIGNLAASQRGASHLLFLVLAAALHGAGYRWMVFTATRGLRNNLGKLGFPLLPLAIATPGHLDADKQAEWGRYYRSEPVVMAGSLASAMQLISERPLLQRAACLYKSRIDHLAERLRGSSR